ncbi:MAG: hypothetical protein NHG36_11440 [Chromatiaceae bacterium]|nr:hypothetical protein [Candidatus Thioaporhodococcus sediminis]
MYYSLAEMDEIRRLRKHLIWAFFLGALASGVQLFVAIGEAFLAGVSEQPSTVFTTFPIVGIFYLWMAFIAYRMAKTLDPSFYYCWTVTALMFVPGVNLIVIISLFMDSGRALAGPKIYK